MTPYSYYALLAFRLILLFNILTASLPLIQGRDDIADIPLTPSQRALLGLEPSSTPATPGSQYITPPRYTRSSTPRDSGGKRTGSPISGKGSPLAVSGSPFNPSGSALWQKTVAGGVARTLSYGSNSPLGSFQIGTDSSSSITPGTPTPVYGKGASVGLSSRWLYDKGRTASGG